jgi:hypothetical protein
MIFALFNFLFGSACRASAEHSTKERSRSRPRLRMRWERDPDNHLVSRWSDNT